MGHVPILEITVFKMVTGQAGVIGSPLLGQEGSPPKEVECCFKLHSKQDQKTPRRCFLLYA